MAGPPQPGHAGRGQTRLPAFSAALPAAPVTGSSDQYSHSPDAPDLLPGANAGVQAPITGGSYQYSHSPEAPDLVPYVAGAEASPHRPATTASPEDHGPKSIVVDRRAPDAIDAADPKSAPVGRGAVFASRDTGEASVSGGELLLGVGVAAGLALLVLLAVRGTKGPRPTISSQ